MLSVSSPLKASFVRPAAWSLRDLEAQLDRALCWINYSGHEWSTVDIESQALVYAI